MPAKESEGVACEVHFQPSGLRARVPSGQTLLAAARQAGVYLTALCGGDGQCGRCIVQVRDGAIQAEPTDLLSPEQQADGCVLACRTRVYGNVEVTVPEEHRLDVHGVLEETLETVPHERCQSLVRKFPLVLKPPTVEECLDDVVRLQMGLLTTARVSEVEVDLAMTRRLPDVLRRGDWRVTVTLAFHNNHAMLLDIEPGDTSQRTFGVAVDVGTTTLVATLIDTAHCTVVGVESAFNSQMQYGEDYIRRIIHAEKNDALGDMQALVVADINALVESLCRQNGLATSDVYVLCCAGNTPMVHMLLGVDPANIRKEPYVPTVVAPPPIPCAQVGLVGHPRALVYCVPGVSAYVGSDITGGAYVTGLHTGDELSLLVDLGTNGEVVLGSREWLVCASASAGAAFEGSGVTDGMRATAGAVQRVRWRDNRLAVDTIDDRPARGICGSGLMSLVAELFQAGILDRRGRFQAGPAAGRVRQGDQCPEFVVADPETDGSPRRVVLTQFDVANLMRSKAAIRAAVDILMESMGVTADQVRHVYLAGGFGNHLDVRQSMVIGMFPEMPVDRVHYVGNTSLAGAKAALLSRRSLSEIRAVASKMTYFDLMHNPRYMEEFVKADFLPHTDDVHDTDADGGVHTLSGRST